MSELMGVKGSLYLIGVVCLLLLLASCSRQLCSDPYIEYKKGDCCLDANKNAVCDQDEKEECPFDCCPGVDFKKKACEAGFECKENDCVFDENYNGFSFKQERQDSLLLWVTEITNSAGDVLEVPFYHHPSDLENIKIPPQLTRTFLDKQYVPDVIYLTFQPDASNEVVIAGVEISRITGFKYNLINIETHPALQWQPQDDSEYSIVTCADATPDILVLNFEPGGYNDIYQDPQEPGCFRFVYKNESEAIKLADRFIYEVLGIMK